MRQRQQDLVGGVRDAGQRVGGEHRQRDALGQQGVLQPVGPERSAERAAASAARWDWPQPLSVRPRAGAARVAARRGAAVVRRSAPRPDVAGSRAVSDVRAPSEGQRARRDHGLRPGRARPWRTAWSRAATRSPSSTRTPTRSAGSAPTSPALTVTGVGFDRDVLIEAGIERADAFAAVSSGDNSNIISARLARETFGVRPGGGPHLRPASGPRCTSGWASRPWPPSAGPPTGCCATWCRRARRDLSRDPTSTVSIIEVPVHPDWIGRPLRRAGGGDRRPGGVPDALRHRHAAHRRPPCCRTATRSSCWSPTTWSAPVTTVARQRRPEGGH